MSTTSYDPQRNLDAVTRFLDVVNAPEASAPESVPSGPALSEEGGRAALKILRRLEEGQPKAVDQILAEGEGSALDAYEALARLKRSGLVAERKLDDGREALALTEDGTRLATVVRQSSLDT